LLTSSNFKTIYHSTDMNNTANNWLKESTMRNIYLKNQQWGTLTSRINNEEHWLKESTMRNIYLKNQQWGTFT
jgi:hypothetical protein